MTTRPLTDIEFAALLFICACLGFLTTLLLLEKVWG